MGMLQAVSYTHMHKTFTHTPAYKHLSTSGSLAFVAAAKSLSHGLCDMYTQLHTRSQCLSNYFFRAEPLPVDCIVFQPSISSYFCFPQTGAYIKQCGFYCFAEKEIP